MSSGLLLGIDEGTTAVKAALFDEGLAPVAESRRPIAVRHPGPGLVEQDAEEILEAVLDAVAEVLEAGCGRPVIAAGIDHQGESVLAWDAVDGRPLTPVIVWQDKRQEALLADVGEDSVKASGLPLDPYFSAGRLAWLIEHDQAVARGRARGSLRLGTVDAFLAERLGGRYAIDLSTASRTQLIALGGRDWDPGLLSTFALRREWLPTIGPSFGTLGVLSSPRWPVGLPLAAQLVDQQAALAGAGAVRPGDLKATYGTGVFVLGRVSGPVSAAGLLPTVAWAAPTAAGDVGEVAHALDGGVFSAGSLLGWLAHGLGMAADVPALMEAAAAAGSEGVTVLPALAGLGAPWWEPGAGGVIAGLHPGVAPANIARAALEAIAWRVADIVEAFETVVPITRLRVDGGLTNDPTLLQLQSDVLGLPLEVRRADTTVLGAALLAGVGAGVFASVEAAAELLGSGPVITPRSDAAERARGRERWRRFVREAARL